MKSCPKCDLPLEGYSEECWTCGLLATWAKVMTNLEALA